MDEKYPAAKARDKATLEQQIMDPCIAKNDAEWWAMSEIERLRAALEEISQPLVTMQDRARKEGYDFNGVTALNIISNPEHYRAIARAALRRG